MRQPAKQPLLPGDAAAPGDELREGVGDAACRVLVVDDYEAVAESIARALRKSGHDVRTALDGHAALKELETFRPQIVFADIRLPRLDGLCLAARLRREPNLQNTMLVAVTSYDDEDTVARIREVFDDCLIKPPALSAMEAMIRTAASRAVEE